MATRSISFVLPKNNVKDSRVRYHIPAEEDIWSACQKGNIDMVRSLIDTGKYPEINIQDEWGNTPLYYACLCGHPSLVTYLLRMGAQDDPFHRCHTNALTVEIRCILKKGTWRQAQLPRLHKPTMEPNMRWLLKNNIFPDVMISLPDHDGEIRNAHSAVLTARWPFFRDRFGGKRQTKPLNAKGVSPQSFDLFLEYLYTGRINSDVAKNCGKSEIEKCRCPEFLAAWSTAVEAGSAKGPSATITTGENQFCFSPELAFAGVECPDASLDLREDATHSIGNSLDQDDDDDWAEEHPAAARGSKRPGGFLGNLFEFPQLPNPDLKLRIAGFGEEWNCVLCHRAILAARSSYFRAMLTGVFAEKSGISQPGEIQEVELPADPPMTPATLNILVRFAYSDQPPTDLTPQNAFDVLLASMAYDFQRLADFCVFKIAKNISPDQATQILMIAHEQGITELRRFVVEYVAVHKASIPDVFSLPLEIVQEVHETREKMFFTLPDDDDRNPAWYIRRPKYV